MALNIPNIHGCSMGDASLQSDIRGHEFEALTAIGRRKTFQAGQVIFWSGDPNISCANVVDGALKITASTENGREQIVGLLFAGDFAGQPFTEKSSFTIAALTSTNLCIYTRPDFERVLTRYPRLEHLLLRLTMRSLDDARQRMLSLGCMNAQERIAGFLLEVIDRTLPAGSIAPMFIELPIKRGEMADFLGLTIETVSRQLTLMRSDGMIEFEKGDRSCLIVNHLALHAAANPH